MPPNKPQTLLSLEDFRSNIGWQPFSFYQLANEKVPLTDSADVIVCEYPWQRPQAAARSDFRRSIQVAEQKLQTFLNYDVSTRYRSEGYAVGYLKNLPRTSAYSNWGGYYGGGYGDALLTLNVGKLQRIATVSYTKLLDFAVTPNDSDGDSLNDTFTGTFADTTSDPAKVIVTFSASDQPNSFGTDASANPLDWQIRPVTVTRLDAGTLQVTGPAWLLVKPVLYERAGLSAGYNSSQTGISSSGTFDPNAPANFVSGLAAWLKVYSLENQATFVRRYGTFEETRAVDATIVDPELGQVQINLAGCFSQSNSPSFWPDRATEEIRINYEAGATNRFGQQAQYLPFQTDWDTVVARFAIAELAQAPAATAKQNPIIWYWRQDLAHVGSMAGGDGDSFRISNDVLGNPFRNTRRGAVEAWLAVQSLAQHRASNL